MNMKSRMEKGLCVHKTVLIPKFRIVRMILTDKLPLTALITMNM